MPNKRPSKKQRITLELTPEAYGELARLAGLAGRDVDEYAAAFLDDALARRVSRKVGVSYRSTLAIREEVAWLAKCQEMSANEWLAASLDEELRHMRSAREKKKEAAGPRAGRHPRRRTYLEQLLSGLPDEDVTRLSAPATCGYQLPYELRARIQAEAAASGVTATDVFNRVVLFQGLRAKTRYRFWAQKERGRVGAGELHARSRIVSWWRPWDSEGHPPVMA